MSGALRSPLRLRGAGATLIALSVSALPLFHGCRATSQGAGAARWRSYREVSATPRGAVTSRQFNAVLPVIDVLWTEVRYGQYLDVTATGTATADLS